MTNEQREEVNKITDFMTDVTSHLDDATKLAIQILMAQEKTYRTWITKHDYDRYIHKVGPIIYYLNPYIYRANAEIERLKTNQLFESSCTALFDENVKLTAEIDQLEKQVIRLYELREQDRKNYTSRVKERDAEIAELKKLITPSVPIEPDMLSSVRSDNAQLLKERSQLTAENAVMRQEGSRIMNDPVYTSRLSLSAWNECIAQPNPRAQAMLEVVEAARQSAICGWIRKQLEEALSKLDQEGK